MRAFIKKLDEKTPLRMGVMLGLSLVFMLMASVYTTPLNRYYGFDSSVFMAFGKGISHGLRPYLDLYDNKGPLIFYINALGYWGADGKYYDLEDKSSPYYDKLLEYNMIEYNNLFGKEDQISSFFYLNELKDDQNKE